MTLGRAMLRAKTIGVRKFRDSLSRLVRSHEMFIVTEHGAPTSVLLPYEDALEIVDILDELRDAASLRAVSGGRKAISAGARGVPASSVFKKCNKKDR